MNSVKKAVTAVDVTKQQIVTVEDLERVQQELIATFRAIVVEIFDQTKSKRFLKSYEVKELLNISSGTLNHMRVNGTLPYTKIGGMLLYEYEDIMKLVEQNKSTANKSSLLRSTGLGMK